MHLRRYFLEIAYQGTHYHGWQLQHNATTVQGTIQEKLAKVLRCNVSITGSGRTDTGVHALQQFAHIDLASTVDVRLLQHQLNAMLPPDIAIVAIHPVHAQAHARFDAVSRTYRYSVVATKDPFLRETSYFLRCPVDIAKMNQAAALLWGEHDFQGFCKIPTDVQHYRCSIMEAYWEQQAGQLIFHIRANRFLRGMVRFVVSHLLQVGLGKCSVATIEAHLQHRSRDVTASLVPACGLTLQAVTYPSTTFLRST